MALADDRSPAFVARAMSALGSIYMDIDKVTEAFRGDGALPWGDHHPCLFSGTEWFFRTGYRAELPNWVAALDGVAAKLDQGAVVADVGCGHGASVVVIANAFPRAEVHGFDFHAPSIETARERADEAGVADRTTFEVADAKGYDGAYDLICFFDCLHDMGDPVGTARYAREHLTADGTVLLVEPFALDERTTNITDNPMAAMLYTVSSGVCTPNSLSQEVGRGLGAQAGEAVLRGVFEEAGYTRFRRAAETPLNLILEARP
jgi:2-polyprenyl-3-methyl-5-hydroxy-6-metoxy-1,4-benzoquinol methylase